MNKGDFDESDSGKGEESEPASYVLLWSLRRCPRRGSAGRLRKTSFRALLSSKDGTVMCFLCILYSNDTKVTRIVYSCSVHLHATNPHESLLSLSLMDRIH